MITDIKVFLALGSNVGKSQQYIQKGIQLLAEKIREIKSTQVYTSKAVGYTDQPDFLNTVIMGETDLSPQDLLKFIKGIEKKVGRVERFRWGPREIDIDIIFYGKEIVNKPGLHIPHPRFSERDFVLKPLCDLDPDFIDPVSKQTIKELYTQLPASKHSIK